MERFTVKIVVRSKDDPDEYLSSHFEVLAADCIGAFKPFKDTALKMRAKAESANA